jgi:solute carrier family 30 (zinc transporter), member 1
MEFSSLPCASASSLKPSNDSSKFKVFPFLDFKTSKFTAISQPVLILAVGSAGLASNLVGLLLFHDHSHGSHPHSHSGGDEPADTTHVHSHDLESNQADVSHSDDPERPTSIPQTNDTDNIVEILPQTIVRRASSPRTRLDTPSLSSSSRRSVHHRGRSHQSFATADDIFVSPAANRRSIVSQAEEIRSHQQRSEDTEDSMAEGEDGYNGDPICTQQQRPHSQSQQPPVSGTTTKRPAGRQHLHRRTSSIKHDQHNHSKPRHTDKHGGGHSHENLNMRGVFLHVLGDALGNIGVIVTALFIWLTDFSWRFYADPLISLVITAIIFSSALPLVKSASLILLQGVPRGISIDDVKEDILQVPFPPS